MAVEEVKTKRKVIPQASEFEIRVAKLQVKLNQKFRLQTYRKLASLLRNRFSLMDALERIYNIVSDNDKHPKEYRAIAVTQWMRSLQNGDSFSVAMRGWAPASELLMLSVGDIANLDEALENLIHVVEGKKKMQEPLVGALAYPMVLMVMVVLIIYGVGAFMVPPMEEAAPNVIWGGQAKSLVDLSHWVKRHPWLLALTLPTIFITIAVTLPRWKGRVRASFDNIPPWSMYRIFVGVSWLLSLAALVKAGTPVSKALRTLRQDANPYLLYRIERALIFVNNGENLGESLFLTGLNFPDKEVIGDLQIYSELDNFAVALDQMANEWLVDSIRSIEQKAAVLNAFAILIIAAVVAWVVLGTFDMQDQLVKAMG